MVPFITFTEITNPFKLLKQLAWSYLKVRFGLNLALVVALVVYFGTEFGLRHIDPLFGWNDAHKMADFTSQVCMAVIGSWIFFFIGDHLNVWGSRAGGYQIVRDTYRMLEDYRLECMQICGVKQEMGAANVVQWTAPHPLSTLAVGMERIVGIMLHRAQKERQKLPSSVYEIATNIGNLCSDYLRPSPAKTVVENTAFWNSISKEVHAMKDVMWANEGNEVDDAWK